MTSRNDDGRMSVSSNRRFCLAVALFAAATLSLPSLAGAVTLRTAGAPEKPAKVDPPGKSPAAHPAKAIQAGAAQGIVQSVGPFAVVLRQLDGTTVTVPVARRITRVFVDGR